MSQFWWLLASLLRVVMDRAAQTAHFTSATRTAKAAPLVRVAAGSQVWRYVAIGLLVALGIVAHTVAAAMLLSWHGLPPTIVGLSFQDFNIMEVVHMHIELNALASPPEASWICPPFRGGARAGGSAARRGTLRGS